MHTRKNSVKQSKPKVSVVVIAYNEERYIGRCLRSLVNQIEKPDEIIVVDNNSTDGTVEIAKKYNARIVTEKKQGMIPARNKGFDTALYPVVARTDADTVLPRNWISTIKKDFLNNSVIALSGPIRYRDEISKIIIKMFVFDMNRILLSHQILIGPNMVIRKSVWEKVKKDVCSDEKNIHEDFDLAIHVSQYGEIHYDPKLVVTTSARRIKNPKSFFINYSYKWANTLRKHKKYNFDFFNDDIKDFYREVRQRISSRA